MDSSFEARSMLKVRLAMSATIFGIESTIVDVTSDPPRILRYGAIKPEMFESLGFSKLHH